MLLDSTVHFYELGVQCRMKAFLIEHSDTDRVINELGVQCRMKAFFIEHSDTDRKVSAD